MSLTYFSLFPALTLSKYFFHLIAFRLVDLYSQRKSFCSRYIHYSLASHIVSELYLKGFPGALRSSNVQNEISNMISELYTLFDSKFQNTVSEV